MILFKEILQVGIKIQLFSFPHLIKLSNWSRKAEEMIAIFSPHQMDLKRYGKMESKSY